MLGQRGEGRRPRGKEKEGEEVGRRRRDGGGVDKGVGVVCEWVTPGGLGRGW